MKYAKKLIVTALVLSLICPSSVGFAKKKTTGYTISKKSGTYAYYLGGRGHLDSKG